LGAWGYNTFENDNALDWVISLVSQTSIKPIVSALSVKADESGFVAASDDCEALAAAETVAALAGRPSSVLPTNVAAWSQGKARPASELLKLSRDVVKRIADRSELKDLWEESNEIFPAWKASVNDLLSRLA